MNVFTYGSLMFEQVWSVVVKGAYRKTTARLYGYQRRRIRGEVYPALIPGTASDQVEGVVYLTVAPSDILRLDHFEGAYYNKKELSCLLPDGGLISACVYVYSETYTGLVEDLVWDPVWFEKYGLQTFMKAYGGYRWIDDAAGAPEAGT